MRRFVLSATLIVPLALLSACGGNSEDNKVTETRMDDLDSLEGTISDDMINTDESTDESPLESAISEQEPTASTSKDDTTETVKKEEPATDSVAKDKAAIE